MVVFFEEAIWKPFLGSTCFGCHGPDGVGARSSTLELSLVPSLENPDERATQLMANMMMASTIAREMLDGESKLVVKARGGADHGGGRILLEGSRNLAMLQAFTSRVQNEGECVETPRGPSPESFEENGEDACSTPAVTERFDATQPVRLPSIKTGRVTHWQLRALISKVLGYYENRLDQRLPPDGSAGPIPNTQDLEISVADYGRYQSAATHVAQKVIEKNEQRNGALFQCEGEPDRSCAEAYLDRVTPRLFRRQATPSELNRLMEIFDIGARGSFTEGMRYLIEALLIYPDTVYHIETGRSDDDAQAERRLSGREIAARLAFFLTAAGPDQSFIDAAEMGVFDTDDGVRDFAETLLTHESKARFALQHFHQRWLSFHDEAYSFKDETLFPDFDDETYRALRQAIVVWTAYVGLKGEGTLHSLMNTASTALPELNEAADFYELDANDRVDTYLQFGIYQLPEAERAGLVTRPAFLASGFNSDQAASRPILRGANLLRDVFCDELVPPVNNFPSPDQPAEQTAADDLAFTVAAQPCKSCHDQINPIGLALESYDAIGRYRVMDRGQPIVVNGDYGDDRLCDIERVRFNSTLAFARSLADNQRVQACYALQWFRYALRRDAKPDDAGALGQILQTFLDSGLNIRALMVAIATSRPFLYRNFADVGE